MNAELPIIWEKHDPAGNSSGNSRNGISSTTVKGDFGELEIEVPREDHRLSEERSGGSDFEAGLTARQSDAHRDLRWPRMAVLRRLAFQYPLCCRLAAAPSWYCRIRLVLCGKKFPAPPLSSFSLAARTLAVPARIPPTGRPPSFPWRRTAPPAGSQAELHLRQAHTFGIHSDDHSPAVSRPFSGSLFWIVLETDPLVFETDPPFGIISNWNNSRRTTLLSSMLKSKLKSNCTAAGP